MVLFCALLAMTLDLYIDVQMPEISPKHYPNCNCGWMFPNNCFLHIRLTEIFLAPKVPRLGSHPLSLELVSFSKKWQVNLTFSMQPTDKVENCRENFRFVRLSVQKPGVLKNMPETRTLNVLPWLMYVCENWMLESSTCMSYIVYIPTVLVIFWWSNYV